MRQKRRTLPGEILKTVKSETKKLLEEDFVRVVCFRLWVANAVHVPKNNKKWRMCIDYMDLNKACLKEVYPFPLVDHLVDSSSRYQFLSFKDAYYGYNQIKMLAEDEEYTIFF